MTTVTPRDFGRLLGVIARHLPETRRDLVAARRVVHAEATRTGARRPEVVRSSYSKTDYRRLRALPEDASGPLIVKQAAPSAEVRHSPHHPWPHYFLEDGAGRAPGVVLWSMWFATSPIQEVHALAATLTARNRELVLKWLGARNHSPPTHADLGQHYGVSRARVGQIVTRFRDRARDWHIRLPWCERFLERIQASGGVLHSSMVDDRLRAHPHALPRLCGLRKLSAGVEYHEDIASWVTDRGHAIIADYRERTLNSELLRHIKRKRTTWGAYPLSLLPPSRTLPPEQLVKTVTSADAAPWRLEDGMVVFPGARSTLVRLTRKALAALGTIHIRDLHAGLDRNVRFSPPSSRQLRAILSTHDDFQVSEDGYVAPVNAQDVEVLLTAAEHTALRILRHSNGVVDREGYIHHMISAGFRPELASCVLRSPFISRVERGIYALRGMTMDADRVQLARNAPFHRLRSSLVKVEHRPSRLLLHYRLSPPCLTKGRLPLPSDTRLRPGKWRASFPDGTFAQLTIRAGAIGGLRPWMRRAALVVASSISLAVDTEYRSIAVTLSE